MPANVPRECRWLRRAALAIRIAIRLLTLACATAAGVVAARTLGGESPWIWTIAVLAGLAAGALLIGNPRLHGIADRIDRVAQEREDRSNGTAKPNSERSHG